MAKARVVSLFSGGGGLDYGFQKEDYDILWAIDNNKNVADTYRHNIGNHIICADINDIDMEKLPECDVVIGGPPCQSFSLIGKRNTEDARAQLVWRYREIISFLQPKAFLFENVTGLMSARDKQGNKILDMLKQSFHEIGYTLSQKVLNAADYGVPQRRKRLILVGLKGDRVFEFPKETHGEGGLGLKQYVSVREALDDLPKASVNDKEILSYEGEPESDYQRMMRSKNGRVSEHFMPQMSELDKYIVAHVKPGGNYMDIPPEVNSARIRRLQRDGGHTTCYGRMAPQQPAYTINTYFNRPNVGCNIHYSEDRLITVREALRLQSFPDDYEIISTSKQGRNLIVGNAVPPLLAAALARKLKDYLQ